MRSALSLGVLLALVAAGLAGAAEHEQAALRLEYVPQPVLEATSGSVAVSPTGRNIYVLGGIDNRTRLAVIGRDPQTGRLWRPAGRADCFRAWYVHARDCGNVPGLNNSFAIAVSPDARDVAIGAYAAPQLAFLRREDSGGLRYRSCLGESVGTFRCGAIRGLDGVEDVAFSPDGRNLYVAARQDNPGLLVLGRNPATGAVQQLRGESGCLQRMGRRQPERPPCAVVPAAWYAPRLVRVTADGRTVVTNSRTNRDGDGIFVFRRNGATGELTPLTCYLVVAKPPCEPYPATRGVADLVIARGLQDGDRRERRIDAVGAVTGRRHRQADAPAVPRDRRRRGLHPGARAALRDARAHAGRQATLRPGAERDPLLCVQRGRNAGSDRRARRLRGRVLGGGLHHRAPAARWRVPGPARGQPGWALALRERGGVPGRGIAHARSTRLAPNHSPFGYGRATVRGHTLT